MDVFGERLQRGGQGVAAHVFPVLIPGQREHGREYLSRLVGKAIGSVKNLGHYAASWSAWWPKRPSSTAALT